jgi:hypothetical protein
LLLLQERRGARLLGLLENEVGLGKVVEVGGEGAVVVSGAAHAVRCYVE